MFTSNMEAIAAIETLKAFIAADKHDGSYHFILDKLIEAKIIDFKPERALNPFRPMPEEWTAAQVALFDNGIPPKTRNRPMIQPTKMQYGGNVKIWTRNDINFKLDSQVAWKANFYLWTHDIAVTVAEQLRDRKAIDDETVALMKDCVDRGGSDYLYAIPVIKTQGKGSQWMKEHIIFVGLNEGVPGHLVVVNRGTTISTSEWSEDQANGAELGGNTIAQARVARDPRFQSWATDIID